MSDERDRVAVLAGWFLDLADESIANARFEAGAVCTHLAAQFLARQNRHLSGQRVEGNLQRLAARIGADEPAGGPSAPEAGSHGKAWLHVLGEALPYGGHTAMAVRWIEHDGAANVHSVALVSQAGRVPEALSAAVARSGGEVHVAPVEGSFVDRAKWLRALARNAAHRAVVLHVDVDDVVAGMAFGVPGGPPVLLINHAAHLFWAGASIPDLVLNCRGSRLENQWTGQYRGVARHATLPIPLVEPPAGRCGAQSAAALKAQARRRLGIADEAVLILTVGDGYKYAPLGDLDFVGVAESILRSLPQAILLAAGPSEDDRWKAASARVGCRLRALGRRSDIAVLHQAADVYVEGFPFGSTTALLEAGLSGLPVVLAPCQCPPPYGSDGVALDDFVVRPASVDAYRQQVLELCTHAQRRSQAGQQLSAAIRQHHLGAGWQRYLDAVVGDLPHAHGMPTTLCPSTTPEHASAYWSRFRSRLPSSLSRQLDWAITLAVAKGVRPKLTGPVLKVIREVRRQDAGESMPASLLYVVCNGILPVTPKRWAGGIYRRLSALRAPRVAAAGLLRRLVAQPPR